MRTGYQLYSVYHRCLDICLHVYYFGAYHTTCLFDRLGVRRCGGFGAPSCMFFE
jgi:hypothetical protein